MTINFRCIFWTKLWIGSCLNIANVKIWTFLSTFWGHRLCLPFALLFEFLRRSKSILIPRANDSGWSFIDQKLFILFLLSIVEFNLLSGPLSLNRLILNELARQFRFSKRISWSVIPWLCTRCQCDHSRHRRLRYHVCVIRHIACSSLAQMGRWNTIIRASFPLASALSHLLAL